MIFVHFFSIVEPKHSHVSSINHAKKRIYFHEQKLYFKSLGNSRVSYAKSVNGFIISIFVSEGDLKFHSVILLIKLTLIPTTRLGMDVGL